PSTASRLRSLAIFSVPNTSRARAWDECFLSVSQIPARSQCQRNVSQGSTAPWAFGKRFFLIEARFASSILFILGNLEDSHLRRRSQHLVFRPHRQEPHRIPEPPGDSLRPILKLLTGP